MKKLINGIVDFRNNVREQYKETFARLALGQRPDALLVVCSDSRVAVNLFASTEPGDLFVVRNVGNMIHPCGHDHSPTSEAAAVEFGLQTLNVKDIIVCGHSECGAMQALAQGRDRLADSHLKSWLENAEGARTAADGLIDAPSVLHNRLSQGNVLLQMQHLKTYPIVQKRLSEGSLRLHGWWFELSTAEVYYFDESKKKFMVIDEAGSKAILGK